MLRSRFPVIQGSSACAWTSHPRRRSRCADESKSGGRGVKISLNSGFKAVKVEAKMRQGEAKAEVEEVGVRRENGRKEEWKERILKAKPRHCPAPTTASLSR